MPEIDTDKVFKKLKKQNGEAAAHIIRDAVLLDVPNIVHILEFAGNNPNEIALLVPVIREIYKTQNQSDVHTDKNPLELLSDAGYDAFVVKTEAQKNSIAKYYRPDEKLCTFGDATRHENYYMIHAVKRGADKIKPFDKPQRDDEYGTSVISIQIAKTGGFISIKNRYNHTVDNPDATFNNNPDEIIPGLTNSLKKYFDVDFNVSHAPIPAHYRMVNDQLVRYNHEINNVYFGSDYYFSGSEITKLNTDYELMLDCFILDTKTGKINDIAQEYKFFTQHRFIDTGIQISCREDSASCLLGDIFRGKKITVQKNPQNKTERKIFANDKHIATVNDNGAIVELNMPGVKVLYNGFLHNNHNLRSFYAPDCEIIEDNCLINAQLEKLYIPAAKTVGRNFCFHNNQNTSELHAQNVEEFGDNCFSHNQTNQPLNFPKLKKTGGYFFNRNENSPDIYMPNIESVGHDFLSRNQFIQVVKFPKLREAGDNFLVKCENIKSLYVPELRVAYDGFLAYNNSLKFLYAPKLETIGEYFLHENTCLIELDAPNIHNAASNKDIKRLKLVIAKNKTQQKGLKALIARLFKKSPNTNN